MNKIEIINLKNWKMLLSFDGKYREIWAFSYPNRRELIIYNWKKEKMFLTSENEVFFNWKKLNW